MEVNACLRYPGNAEAVKLLIGRKQILKGGRIILRYVIIDTDGMLQVGMQYSTGGICLLYTSDAADEEDSVDFVGLRNIKKKKKKLFFFFFKQKTAYEM